MNTICIRRLTPSDVEALCALASEVWRAHYPAIIGSAQTEYMLAQRYDPSVIRDELGREDISWIVACESDALLAFASFHTTTPGELKIDKLYVHPSRQRRGIGGMLIDEACDAARARGLGLVTLAVNKRNTGAIGAYRKHGFDVRDSVVKDIGEGFVMDDYVMTRIVTGEPVRVTENT